METYHIISLTKQGKPVSVCTTKATSKAKAESATAKFCWGYDITVHEIVTDEEYADKYSKEQVQS